MAINLKKDVVVRQYDGSTRVWAKDDFYFNANVDPTEKTITATLVNKETKQATRDFVRVIQLNEEGDEVVTNAQEVSEYQEQLSKASKTLDAVALLLANKEAALVGKTKAEQADIQADINGLVSDQVTYESELENLTNNPIVPAVIREGSWSDFWDLYIQKTTDGFDIKNKGLKIVQSKIADLNGAI